MIIFSLIVFFVLIFLIYNVILYIVIVKAFKGNNLVLEKKGISIVIAAKNEEKNIPALIDTLSKLDYNNHLFEVIIIDDNSSDNTFQKTEKLINSKPNFSIIKAGNKNLPGKKGALTIGIEKAKHDFILITDADCIPQKDWLSAYAVKFGEGFDLIFGVAPFLPEKSFVNEITRIENLRSSILTFAAASFGIPYSAAARNFGFRKSSFKMLEGYSKTTETLSGDDDLLIREAFRKKMKIGFVTNKNSFVYSSAKEKLKDYLSQKARHTQTSIHYLPIHKVLLGSWHLLNLTFLLSLFLIFIDPIFVYLFLIKFLADIIVVNSLQTNFGYNFKLLKIIYLQFFYEVFLIIHFVNALKGKSDWKEKIIF